MQEVVHSASKLGLQTFMVGATARIILLEHVHGLPPSRATRDIDFAFAVESWEQYQKLKQHLSSKPSFTLLEHIKHRLIFKPTGETHSYEVDLIPFGGVESHDQTIAWPPDMSIIMNVVGYNDVNAAAVHVEVEPGLVVPIASLPGIAVLKIFAWLDRGVDDPKDAFDLVTLLRQYHEAGNLDRIYEEAPEELEKSDYDIELTGAWLLGMDASALTSPITISKLNALLSDPSLTNRLVTDMAKALRARDDAIEYARALLEQFKNGLLKSGGTSDTQ